MFSDTEYTFTPPTPSSEGPLFPSERYTFAELYLDCLVSSIKGLKTLREKMAESQEFAVNFGKTCLLVNLNRLNTTHALIADCRSLNRTFNSIPAFQIHEYSRKHTGDAPRLKAHLKGCMLPEEVANGPPEGLRAIAGEAAAGQRPSTSVVNIIFALVNESAWVTSKYFPQGFTFADVLLRRDIPSFHRANALLFVIHRFLEDPNVVNDFSPSSGPVTGIAFMLCDPATEDVEPEDEIEYARTVKIARAELVASIRAEKRMATESQFNPPPASVSRTSPDAEGSIFSYKEATPVPSMYTRQLSHFQGEEKCGLLVLPVNSKDKRHLATAHQWQEAMPKMTKSSYLTTAYQRTVSEKNAGIDPTYDSDDESSPSKMTSVELFQRVNIFQFANTNAGSAEKIVFVGKN